jgi:hypothetical protein
MVGQWSISLPRAARGWRLAAFLPDFLIKTVKQ